MSHRIPDAPLGMQLTRRGALGGIGAALTVALTCARPPAARAAVSFAQRLVVLNIRGGLDGMSAVVPYGDINLGGLRAPLIPPAVGQTGGMFDLGGFYGLNPAMPNLYAMYQAGQMLAVHAVGGILLTRSHFAGQDAVAQGEAPQAGALTGWINRLVGLLQTVPGGVEAGVGFAADNPAIVQGPALMGAFTPQAWVQTPNTLAALVETLGASDPLIGQPIQSGFNDRALFAGWLAGNAAPSGKSQLQTAMRDAGIFLAASGGPAVVVIQSADADTHVQQVSRLAGVLADIDAGIGLLQAGAGSVWASTVVITVTEFGRTAAVNGGAGTDHGTGFAMFIAGGAVAGGRVIATWPGLGASQLYDGRDLAPTIDMRAPLMGVLRDHLGLSAQDLATVFPGASNVTPLGGLVTG